MQSKMDELQSKINLLTPTLLYHENELKNVNAHVTYLEAKIVKLKAYDTTIREAAQFLRDDRSEKGINICDCYIDEEDSDFEGCQGECLDNDPFEKQLWDMPGLVAITLAGYVAEQNKWKESIESHNKWIIRLKNEINGHNFAITQILKEKNT
jgi:chromosome segregation ATPase